MHTLPNHRSCLVANKVVHPPCFAQLSRLMEGQFPPVEVAAPAGGAAAGNSRHPAPKQPKVADAAFRAGAGAPAAAQDLQNFRYSGGPGGQAGAHHRSSSGAQQQQQVHEQQRQQAPWQQQRQQQQMGGHPSGPQPMARPSSAGPFGRPEGVSYNHAAGQAACQAQRNEPADPSPEWRSKKRGGASGVPAAQINTQRQQQQQGADRVLVQSTVLNNISDAFGGGFGRR